MRPILLGFCLLALTSACGGASKSRAAATLPTLTGSSAPITTELEEQLVVEGALHLEISEPKGLIDELRGKVEAAGGRIVKEEVSGLDQSWHAQLTLRVPPQQLESVVAYLGSRGTILDKAISATDVGKTLFDQELALKNAQATLDRLEAILRQGGLSMQDVLAVEREMTRLRGEVESIKGQAQFLKDRVALATLDVTISRKSNSVTIASAKVYPGARFSSLFLLSPDGRKQGRLGGGFVLHTVFRAATFEVDLYESARGPGDSTDSSHAVLATFGGAFYSDFLGRGERAFGNPYLGFRLGYGFVDSHRFILQAEAGLELWKSKRVSIDVNARATGLIGSRSDAAAVLGASAALAF